MGLFDKIFKKLSGALAAKEISPHSWDNPRIEKQILDESEIESFLPHLQIYLGEDNFQAIYDKYIDSALHIEKTLNFIGNTGEPLNREISFLLSFDVAKVMEKQRHKLHQLRSIIVYPTYLPKETEAAGFMYPRGPRGFVEDLSTVRASIELTNWVINRPPLEEALINNPEGQSLIDGRPSRGFKNINKHFYLETLSLEEHFESVKKGMDNQSLTRWKTFLKKTQDFIEKNYTEATIAAKKKSASPQEQGLLDNLVAPEMMIKRMQTFCQRWDDVIPVDQFSIHLSWVQHLEYMAHQGKNLFIHELAHVIDFQNLYSFSFHGDSEWEKLRRHYLEDQGDSFALGAYALTNAKELFAVASEFYFRNPKLLQDNGPDLFQRLKQIYGPVPFEQQPISVGKVLSLVRKISPYDSYKKAS